MGVYEAVGSGAGGLTGLATKVALGIGGLTAIFKMHESVDADERAIILNRGRVKVDREKLEADFGTRSVRKAQKFIVQEALAQGATKKEAKNTQLDRTEYAVVYGAGSHFVFFSLRALRKIKITHETTDIPAQNMVVGKEKQQLDSTVTWAVDASGQNPARAMLRARTQEELKQRVASKVGGAARESILDLDSDKEHTNYRSGEVFEQIKARCGDDLIRTYGAVLLGYEILSLAPSEAERGRNIRFEGTDGQSIEPDEVLQTGLRLLSNRDAAPDASA